MLRLEGRAANFEQTDELQLQPDPELSRFRIQAQVGVDMPPKKAATTKAESKAVSRLDISRFRILPYGYVADFTLSLSLL